MAENFTIDIRGIGEQQKALYTFSQRLGDRVVLGALRQGANLVLKSARQKAPFKTGKLRKGIILRASKIHKGKFSTDLIGVYITVKRKEKTDPFYGRFQEDGWIVKGRANHKRFSQKIKAFTNRSVGSSSRVTQGGGRHIPGKHFIENAWLENREQAVNLIVRAATAGSEVLAKKLGLSYGR
jgi:HK97 gp10 family phage protein